MFYICCVNFTFSCVIRSTIMMCHVKSCLNTDIVNLNTFLKHALENRVGNGKSSKMGVIDEEEYGTTTIGFGAAASKSSSNSNSAKNVRGSSSTSINGKLVAVNGAHINNGKSNGSKSVSFAHSFNKSDSAAENSDEDNNDNDETESHDENQAASASQANMFVSEAERKTYLEQQFQASVAEYQKIAARLESCSVCKF